MDFETRYRRPSELSISDGASLAFLAAGLGPAGLPAEPVADGLLFRGEIQHPLLLRRLLSSLHAVVTSRFDDLEPTGFLDPVITVGGEVVRLEAFSGCAGVYARADLGAEMFDPARFGAPGTTNVDFNPAFVRQLASLRPDRPSHFEVGPDSLRLKTHRGEAMERKVPLPERWVRGFLQVQAAQQRAKPWAELSAPAARQLIHVLPALARQPLYIDASRTPRRLSRRRPAAVGRGAGERILEVAGAHRLRLLRGVLPGARRVRVFRVATTGASVWICDAAGGHYTLAISGGLRRGFSGDGDALLRFADPADDLATASAVRRILQQRQVASVEELVVLLGDSPAVLQRGLDVLAGQGLVGFDRGSDRYFYRVLPYAVSRRATPPRQQGARQLVDSGAVELESRTRVDRGTALAGWVRGRGGDYRVRATVVQGALVEAECTCRWVRRHGLERGPCKHLLALCAEARCSTDLSETKGSEGDPHG